MESQSIEERNIKHENKVNNALKRMASQVSAKVNELMKEITDIRENQSCVCKCQCNAEVESLKNSNRLLGESLTQNSSGIKELSEKVNDVSKLHDEIINYQTKIKVIDERIRSLENEQLILKQTILEKFELSKSIKDNASSVNLDEAIIEDIGLHNEDYSEEDKHSPRNPNHL